ncbi:DUF4148 domain-containing protein [Burkholderia gladioli]|uniref:DUF4148 domain-containing protein n=1 Tax=Burkholderia gladioli TaxID=28095 RepID=UPI00163E1AD2|nr:DUF4148 domain-containing protein [Burkholderia gladioli]
MKTSIRKISYVLCAFMLSAPAAAAFATDIPGTTLSADISAQSVIQQYATPEVEHALTRREVIDELIKAQQDGSLERLNHMLYRGS